MWSDHLWDINKNKQNVLLNPSLRGAFFRASADWSILVETKPQEKLREKTGCSEAEMMENHLKVLLNFLFLSGNQSKTIDVIGIFTGIDCPVSSKQ